MLTKWLESWEDLASRIDFQDTAEFSCQVIYNFGCIQNEEGGEFLV